MKKCILSNLIIIVALFSCHEDNIIESIETEIEDPILIDNNFVSGKITDPNGVALDYVEIELYQNGELMGSVISGDQGNYSTESIGVLPDMEIVLKYSKEEFSDKYRSFDFTDNSSISKNVILGRSLNQDQINTDNAMNSTPLDANTITLYGYARFKDTSPANGTTCMAVWEFEPLIFGSGNVIFIERWARDIADEDGYWEMSVPMDTTVYFQAYYQAENSGYTSCSFDFTPELPLAPNELGQIGRGYVDLGMFTQNTEIELNSNIERSIRKSQVGGRANTCDGKSVSAGNIHARIGKKLGNIILPEGTLDLMDYNFGNNGEFSFTIEGCDNLEPAEWQVSVSIEDTLNNWSQQFTFDYNTSLVVGDLYLCWDQNDYQGELILTYGSTTLNFGDFNDHATSGTGTLLGGTSISNDGPPWEAGDLSKSFYMGLENMQLGQNEVSWIRLWHLEYQSHYFQVYEKPFDIESPPNITAYITLMDNQWVEGYVEGQIETLNGNEEIRVDFRFYDK